MTTSRSRTALAMFFLVGFGVPWAGAIVARLQHVNSPQITPGFMIVGAFCSIAGVLATYLESGASGLRDLARRCLIYRVPVVWWIYALLLPLGVHVIATFIYAAAHRQVVPFKPTNLFRQWWMLYLWAFGFVQGPLAEELGWRGYLLPRLLRKYSPLKASIFVGVVWAAWHFEIFFHSVAADALFAAAAVAFSILMTVLFLHTRGSVLLAITMHGAVMPGKNIAQALFPTADQPPDWLRAVAAIAIAIVVAVMTRGKLGFAQKQPALRYSES